MFVNPLNRFRENDVDNDCVYAMQHVQQSINLPSPASLCEQKAQEARERTAVLRQSIQKGGGGREARTSASVDLSGAAAAVPRLALPSRSDSLPQPQPSLMTTVHHAAGAGSGKETAEWGDAMDIEEEVRLKADSFYLIYTPSLNYVLHASTRVHRE